MLSSLQKWGNSLALRIPKPMAESLGVGPGSQVKIHAEVGRIVITPMARYSLAELLDKVTAENIHGETDSSGPVGGEVW